MKKLVILLFMLITVGFAYVAGNYSKFTTYTPPVAAEKVYQIPQAVLPIVDAIGIDKKVLSRVEIQMPQDSGPCRNNANSKEPTACFQAPSLIIFPASQLSKGVEVRNSSFAHEYMHYIWSTMSADQQAALYPALDEIAARNPDLRGRLKNYTVDAKGRYNELHSYTCTEMADFELSDLLREHCQKWLPNRQALPSYY